MLWCYFGAEKQEISWHFFCEREKKFKFAWADGTACIVEQLWGGDAHRSVNFDIENSNYTRWNILIGYAWKKAFTQKEDDSCVGPSSTLYAPNVFILSLTKARSRNVWLYYATSFDLLGLFPSRSCIGGSESEGPSQLLIGEFEGWSKFSVRLKLGQKDLVWKCQCELWEIVTDIVVLD